MTLQSKNQLLQLLYEYYTDLSKTCNYDCCNCDLGILDGYGYGHSCSIETVARKLEEELYE